MHQSIATVTDHVERLRFNTALAALMDELNYLARLEPAEIGRAAIESYVLMLAPMAPHVAEEFWRALGHKDSVHRQKWPSFDPALAKDEVVTVVVQINGKVRDKLEVAADSPEDQIRALAFESAAVQRHLDGKTPKKVIYEPNKLLSIVV
jgi:leucyl-tRNA synthetase